MSLSQPTVVPLFRTPPVLRGAHAALAFQRIAPLGDDGRHPGTYLARKRIDAGLSLEDLARDIQSTPYPMKRHDRVAWLRRIEAGTEPLGWNEAGQLLSLIDLRRSAGLFADDRAPETRPLETLS